MLDRESTFADPEIVKMLQTRFIPVALDQAYQRRQQDTEGEFYRKIAGQGPRNDFNSTTQGFYIATAAGDLLLFNNNRDPEKVRRLMQEKLRECASLDLTGIPELQAQTVDPRWNVNAPEGGLVVRVQAKVLDGYEPPTDQWWEIFQNALSRDNLWITADEHRALVRGEMPVSLQRRIARYHLVDNTRGEPAMWRSEEIVALNMSLDAGKLTGAAHLETDRGERGYEPQFRGVVEVQDGVVTRFDAVALGESWGEGRFTRGAPEGRFPLAISFTLADGADVADRVPPQGSRGWVDGYLR